MFNIFKYKAIAMENTKRIKWNCIKKNQIELYRIQQFNRNKSRNKKKHKRSQQCNNMQPKKEVFL